MLKYLLLCSLLVINAYALSSSALYISKDQKFLYSANLDAGSVSKTSLKDKKLLKEIKLGKDLRRIAFNENESIYAVSDYAKNVIYIMNAKNDKLIKTIKTPE